MDSGSMPFVPPANDPGGAEDVRVELRKDHDAALRDLEALGREKDERRCQDRLRELRQAWMTHALAEETVVYRALEGVQASARADERFIEHELVGGLFEKLAQARPGTHEWSARLKVIVDLIRRHIDIEHNEVFSRLAKHVDPKGLRELGENFRSVHAKLRMLERLKAA
jgi:hemerythrin HHE cation binding domain-containing protein